MSTNERTSDCTSECEKWFDHQPISTSQKSLSLGKENGQVGQGCGMNE